MSDFAEFNLLIHNGQHRLPASALANPLSATSTIPACARCCAPPSSAFANPSPPATKLQPVFQKATSVIDRVADKNIIHKNKAARHKSRLAAAIKALA